VLAVANLLLFDRQHTKVTNKTKLVTHTLWTSSCAGRSRNEEGNRLSASDARRERRTRDFPSRNYMTGARQHNPRLATTLLSILRVLGGINDQARLYRFAGNAENTAYDDCLRPVARRHAYMEAIASLHYPHLHTRTSAFFAGRLSKRRSMLARRTRRISLTTMAQRRAARRHAVIKATVSFLPTDMPEPPPFLQDD